MMRPRRIVHADIHRIRARLCAGLAVTTGTFLPGNPRERLLITTDSRAVHASLAWRLGPITTGRYALA